MKKIQLITTQKKQLADIHTPVGIYLRLRDRFRDTILLESTDHHATDNSFSFIGVNAIAGIEITDNHSAEIKFPNEVPVQKKISRQGDVMNIANDFMQRFTTEGPANIAQGLFGYTSYDAIPFFETIRFRSSTAKPGIPLMRYRLYQYVIAINHFKDEMTIYENHVAGIESELSFIESLIQSKDVPVFPFKRKDAEERNMQDEDYLDMVEKGIQHCKRGDVFQVVLSRRFQQQFTGDEFNVYRALRNVNPSPYLFYFDYGDYRLIGSSPESQLVIKAGEAIVHPIAGTVQRSGDAAKDKDAATRLINDPKENAEHVMLVDLARNDLSRTCMDVEVNYYKQVHYYSHVIHLVSEVSGKMNATNGAFTTLTAVFPAGTLSGAPKYKAMQLIDQYEPTPRGYYGGCIGYIGFDGSCNHAIMIRTFLSMQNTLHYQAGAGVVAASLPQNELKEVEHKLQALKTAIELAETL